MLRGVLAILILCPFAFAADTTPVEPAPALSLPHAVYGCPGNLIPFEAVAERLVCDFGIPYSRAEAFLRHPDYHEGAMLRFQTYVWVQTAPPEFFATLAQSLKRFEFAPSSERSADTALRESRHALLADAVERTELLMSGYTFQRLVHYLLPFAGACRREIPSNFEMGNRFERFLLRNALKELSTVRDFLLTPPTRARLGAHVVTDARANAARVLASANATGTRGNRGRDMIRVAIQPIVKGFLKLYGPALQEVATNSERIDWIRTQIVQFIAEHPPFHPTPRPNPAMQDLLARWISFAFNDEDERFSDGPQIQRTMLDHARGELRLWIRDFETQHPKPTTVNVTVVTELPEGGYQTRVADAQPVPPELEPEPNRFNPVPLSAGDDGVIIVPANREPAPPRQPPRPRRPAPTPRQMVAPENRPYVWVEPKPLTRKRAMKIYRWMSPTEAHFLRFVRALDAVVEGLGSREEEMRSHVNRMLLMVHVIPLANINTPWFSTTRKRKIYEIRMPSGLTGKVRIILGLGNKGFRILALRDDLDNGSDRWQEVALAAYESEWELLRAQLGE